MQNSSVVETVLNEIGAACDADFNAARAGLYLAALDNPHADLARYEAHLCELAEATAARAADAPAQTLGVVMNSLYGYRGDRQTYDDMKNADLIQVIDRRRGLPVALGLLYLAAAKGLSARLVGLSFPGHFLMRIECEQGRTIIDPFNDGRPCDSGMLRNLAKRAVGGAAELDPAYFEPVTARAIVIRLLMNIRIRALKAGDRPRAVEIVRRITLIAPGDARAWADLAELHTSCGNLGAAKAAYLRSIDGAPSKNFRAAAEAALDAVNRRLN